ncbi:MAG: CPBP family intramembrane metalloprotease [Bacteroidales bacterium]|nr:CPBP family intramembrane metalloprotease [Bacteroidales bacterium]
MKRERDIYPNRYSCDGMPLWRWMLLFIGGIILFTLLYAFAQGTALINPVYPRCIALVVASIVILLVYLLCVSKAERREVQELRAEKFFPSIGAGLGLGVVYFCAVIGIMAALGSYKVTSAQFDFKEVLSQICLFFMVAVGEEVLFRGVIHRMISMRWNGIVALIISGLIFGFAHMTEPNATVWSSFAIAVEAGLMIGAAYEFSGNLWMPIGIHWAWNFMEGPFFGTGVSGKEVGFSILSSEVSGSDLVTGGSFGPEASVIAFVLGLVIALILMGKALSKE